MKCPICKLPKTIKAHVVQAYEYYRCRSCKTVFLKNKLSERSLTTYYQKTFDYNTGLQRENEIRKRARIILHTLRRLNPKGKTLLDIGSGYGFFCDESTKFGLETKGVEPSRALCTYAKNHCAGTYFLNNLDNYSLKNRLQYDFITFIHVIEHIRKPEDSLRYIAEFLRPKGILYIETPNADSHLYYAELNSYTFLTPPEHLWIFSRQSFYCLLKKIKTLQLRKNSTYSYPEHCMGILKIILKRLLNKISVKKSLLRNNTETIDKKTIRKSQTIIKKIKFLIFDSLISRLICRLINIGDKGTFLELYTAKK